MLIFIFGFLTGVIFSFLFIFIWAVYAYAKTAEQAHKDGYENPYL
jgi:Na+-transporting methylmalonyl-CoA/oxaloacetate decarboxylase gamma subunit